jgi:class 3 adenylate cyclase/tetratricopeptide (TPR) repeat protein
VATKTLLRRLNYNLNGRVKMRCSKCGANNPTGKKFCGDCGAPLTNLCPKCGAENPPGQRFCGDCGTALLSRNASAETPSNRPNIVISAEHTDPAVVDGERKMVTALFADIKGSMELMEDLDPEEARRVIDPALKIMMDAVHQYGGYIVQSTGDGVFALFGAPVAHEDHPQRSLYAALRMQEAARRYSAQLVAEGGTPLEARVGVNTGEVVVRTLTTADGHTEYTPIGHTANLASRMQAIAPTGSIAMTEQTRRLVEGFFQVKPLGPTRVKGLTEPINVYEVTGLGPLRTRLQRAAARGLTRFVGRDREMDALRHALEQAQAGHGQIVAAMADPGVGKSRLFYEFKLTSQYGCMVLEAYSVSHGKASSYVPVIELLHDYFRIVADDHVRQRRQKVIGKLLELDRSLEDVLPYLFALLGLHNGDDPMARMDAQIRRRRTQEGLKRIFIRESLQQPLIIIFEDLHWIDAETQAVLNLLADSIVNARILLLVNYRPEYRHDWGHRTHYTQLRLDPLGVEGAQEMLTALLTSPAPAALPAGASGERSAIDIHVGGRVRVQNDLASLRRLILERTQGNPFFIEEMVQVLFDEGVVVRDGAAVKVARPLSQVHIPTTVQGVLASRIDRLPPAEKQLLQTLAVIGREFQLPLIRRVARAPEDALDEILSHLQNADFINEEPAFPDIKYTFKHALTQEVAYNSLLAERRQLIHQQIAEAMESWYAERLDDHLKELALHYSRSGNTLKAIEYLRLAGEQAASRAFLEEAISRLEAALGLLPKAENAAMRDEQELAIRMALVMPLLAANSIANQQNVSRARLLCEQLGQSQLLARVLYSQFFVHWELKKFASAKECTEQLQALAATTSDEITCFLAGFTAGWLSLMSADYIAARNFFGQALNISDDTSRDLIKNLDTAIGFVNCTGSLGMSLWMLGYPEQARKQHARVLDLLGGPLDAYARANGILHELMMSDFIRDDRRMLEAAQRMLTLGRESGATVYLGPGMIYLGRAIAAEGRVDRAIQAVTEGREIIRKHGELATLDVFEHGAPAAYLAAGKTDEGFTIVEEMIEKWAAGGVRFYEADLHRLKGELLLAAGAPMTDAEDFFRMAITTAQRQQAKSWELRATLSLARLLMKQGRRAEAHTMLSEIYGWFTEGFDTADLKDAKALLDQLQT